MWFSSIDSIENELYEIYNKYFQWFKDQEFFLKDWVNTSHPFFVNFKAQLWNWLTEFNNLETILIFWQETYWYPSKNWVNHKTLNKANIWEIFNKRNSIEDAIIINKIYSIGFDFPEFKKESVVQFDIDNETNIKLHYKWPFWNLIKNIRKKKKHIICSNIIKFDIYRNNNWKRRIKSSELLNEKKECFYEKHRKLIENEIRILNPSKILFFSSPNDEKSIYNKIIWDLLILDDTIGKDYLKWGVVKKYNIPFIQSYHPRRLNFEERSVLLELI